MTTYPDHDDDEEAAMRAQLSEIVSALDHVMNVAPYSFTSRTLADIESTITDLTHLLARECIAAAVTQEDTADIARIVCEVTRQFVSATKSKRLH